jgi:predicted transcriptional regulator of viral defense system
MVVFNIAVLLGVFLVIILVNIQIADLRKSIADLLYQYEGEETEVFSDATETASKEELEYMERIAKRDAEFDQRITRIKEELANEGVPQKPRGTVAEILAPGIENLPHDSIRDYEKNPPDTEYTL